MLKFLRLMAAALLGLAALPAAAHPGAPAPTYAYTFSGTNALGNAVTGNVTFSTSDTANSDGSFNILGTSGSLTTAGVEYTFSGPSSWFGADNTIMPGVTGLFSLDGTSADFANGESINFYAFNRGDTVSTGSTDAFTVTLDSFAAAGAVPEPATWAMLILGFGLVGGALRRRQATRAAPAFA
jgi:hypothetical protein